MWFATRRGVDAPGNNTERSILLRNVQTKFTVGGFAFDTAQRSNCAAAKNVQIKLSEGDCVLGMGPSANDAAAKDALIKVRQEECA